MLSPENYKLKTAVISVSDKTGIAELAKELVKFGIEIYSTGGTASLLQKEGIAVRSVSDLTNFPEIMDGRVKTLHPAIHAGLLACLDNEEHTDELKKQNMISIDLLIVNLYPFEQTLAKADASHEELIENIDIGGPTMLRAAAKNYRWTAPIVNPAGYSELIGLMNENNGCLPESYRRKLASEVFAHTAYYDSVISNNFLIPESEGILPANATLPLKLEYNLRYGENPHQKAALYGNFSKIFTKLHGKELSYNNLLDIDGAARIILEFERPTFAIIKHTNPCGIGQADNLCDAYDKAFATDTVSPFGGIFAVNREMDKETAQKIHGIFSEVIIAPSYSEEALAILQAKKDRRLIRADYDALRKALKFEIRSVTGGFLVQDTDNISESFSNMKVVTKRQPTEEELQALLFGWKVVKHVKSNAIVYTKSDRTLGIGAGQMSRVDSARIAVEKAGQMGLSLAGSAVASDAFFPFADGVLQAVEAGATAVIQPGGSVRDEEVIKAADDNNIAMIFTGIRHFKH